VNNQPTVHNLTYDTDISQKNNRHRNRHELINDKAYVAVVIYAKIFYWSILNPLRHLPDAVGHLTKVFDTDN
jgi:hypothetical protein